MTDGPPSTPKSLRAVLSATDGDLLAKFAGLVTVADVADLLEVRESQLSYILWRSPVRQRYTVFDIKKRRGGIRQITAPNKSLKILQRKLAHVLGLIAKQRNSVHGFRRGRSIVTNAKCHVKQRFVFDLDLENFFPSINFGRIRGMLWNRPYLIGERAATAIAQLCCYEQLLPQGAPTSPIISNMICAKLDGELQRLAKQYDCFYTRYADDITFSTSRSKFPSAIVMAEEGETKALVGSILEGLIKTNGFVVNAHKVYLRDNTRRQTVTGLIVNRRPNVSRRFTNQVRAMLHAWGKFGLEAAQREFLQKFDTKPRVSIPDDQLFKRVIRGKLDFLSQVRGKNDSRYCKLRHLYAVLSGEIIASAGESMPNNYQYDVFICHSSDDKAAVAKPLAKALKDSGVRVWIDEGEITWGDNITQKINHGLSNSRFVIIVLSESFLSKNWAQAEMYAVLNKEFRTKVPAALPLMNATSTVKDRILNKYPLLSDRQYETWSPADVGHIVSTLKSKLQKLLPQS